jgi:hypothetical protein
VKALSILHFPLYKPHLLPYQPNTPITLNRSLLTAMEFLASHGDNHSLARDQFPLSNSSDLSAGLLHLPPTFLDAIIPGYSILAQTLLSHFGIDLSFYISLLALFFAAATAFHVTVNPVIERVFALTTSTVIVDEYDSIFSHVLDWLSSQKSLQSHRILRY